MTIKQANRKLSGTGAYIIPGKSKTKTGKIRVVSEGEGDFLFAAKNLNSAVKRGIERFEEQLKENIPPNAFTYNRQF